MYLHTTSANVSIAIDVTGARGSQNEIRMPSEVPEPVSREYHSLVASQLPEAPKEIYFTSTGFVTLRPGISKEQFSVPCSAKGSREALGSSNNNMPAEVSVSEANERMNVRELFDKSALTPERSRYIHIHCKPLPLPATETQMTGGEAPNAF
jgi:hypothetical protein